MESSDFRPNWISWMFFAFFPLFPAFLSLRLDPLRSFLHFCLTLSDHRCDGDFTGETVLNRNNRRDDKIPINTSFKCKFFMTTNPFIGFISLNKNQLVRLTDLSHALPRLKNESWNPPSFRLIEIYHVSSPLDLSTGAIVKQWDKSMEFATWNIFYASA